MNANNMQAFGRFARQRPLVLALYGALFLIAYGTFVMLLLPDWEVTALAVMAGLVSAGILSLGIAEFLLWNQKTKLLRLWLIAAVANLTALFIGFALFGGTDPVGTLALATCFLFAGLRLWPRGH